MRSFTGLPASASFPGSPGGDEVSGEVTRRARVQRRVADEQAVPQHAVGQVDQHAEVGASADHLMLAASPGAIGSGPFADLDEGALRQAFDGKFFAYGTVLECAGGANLTVGAVAG